MVCAVKNIQWESDTRENLEHFLNFGIAKGLETNKEIGTIHKDKDKTA